ncbi:hypothetical protein [Mesorhizobium sp. AA22]|uniref:hypothetical protein n=1 Tax=Mesorhizobium sp. AA22 TaxID=1854057 RepID=UPI0007EC9578|nr:hypothetical protein [Mesorhizobium sp. AA22]QIA23282.1 hypothetical protein A9K68_017010 [Mesorhizobium sp. AA22]
MTGYRFALSAVLGLALELGSMRDARPDFLDVVGEIAGLPEILLDPIIEGRPGDIIPEILGKADTVKETFRGVLENPSILVDYAKTAAACAPTATSLIAGTPEGLTAAASDLASNGPCSQFMQKCNEDGGDMICPDVDGVRGDLKAFCNASEFKSVLGLIGASQKEVSGAVGKFCTTINSSAVQNADKAFGRNVSSTTAEFAGHATGGENSEAIQVILKASLNLEQANKLSREQLSLLKEMAENQGKMIDKLLDINQRTSETAIREMGRMSQNQIDSDKIFAAFATDALQTVSASEAARTEAERIARLNAERLAELYLKNQKEAERQLRELILSAAVKLSASQNCLARLEVNRADRIFCKRFPNAAKCKTTLSQSQAACN